MPNDLVYDLILQKNKLFENQPEGEGVDIPVDVDAELDTTFGESGHMVDLFEIWYSDTACLRYANDAANVMWNDKLWSKMPMEPGDYSEGDGHDKFRIRISNIDGTIEELMDANDGFVGATAFYRYVHTGYRSLLISREYEILTSVPSPEWVEFECGWKSIYSEVFPSHTFSSNLCRYHPHQTDVCSYVNSLSCDRTFGNCISLGRSAYFGGQPGLPGAVINVE